MMQPDHALGSPELVFPLDVPNLHQARRWVDKLREVVPVFKVGLELFTAVGPDAVRMVHDSGRSCFLDLKLHDISETVERTVEVVNALGVRFLTIHAANGPETLSRVAKRRYCAPTRILAVTVLTNLAEPDLRRLGFALGAGELTKSLAQLCLETGIQGCVCSAHEVSQLRAVLGPDATIAVPGLRRESDPHHDQARVATPRSAAEAGANLLVVGRPIREAVDPLATAYAIAESAGCLPLPA